jgi:hypothetical protein
MKKRTPNTKNAPLPKRRKVESLEKISITDVRFINEAHLRKCMKIVKKDTYIAESLELIKDLVLQGHVEVRLGPVRYPGFSPEHSKHLIEQLKKAIDWHYTAGFIPFGFRSQRYVPRDQRGTYSTPTASYGNNSTQQYGHPLPQVKEEMSVAREIASDLNTHPENTFIAPVVKDQGDLMRAHKHMDGGIKKYTQEPGAQGRGNQTKSKKMDILKQLFNNDQMPDQIARIMPGISSLDSRIAEEFDLHLERNQAGGQMFAGTSSSNTGQDNGLSDMYKENTEEIAPNPFDKKIGNIGGGPNPSADSLLQGRAFLVNLLLHIKDKDEVIKKYQAAANGQKGTESTSTSTKADTSESIVDVDDSLNAQDGDLDFYVPDLDVNFGTFVAYREKGINATKVFVRLKDDDLDDDEDNYLDEYNDGYIHEDDDEYSNVATSGAVLFPNGTVGTKGPYGVTIGADYVTAQARRAGYPGNPFDGIPTEDMIRMDQKKNELIAQGIGQTNASLLHTNLVMGPGEYLPGENVKEQYGIKTNIEPELYNLQQTRPIGGGNPSELDMFGRPKYSDDYMNYSQTSGQYPGQRGGRRSSSAYLSHEQRRAMSIIRNSKHCYYVFATDTPDSKGFLQSKVARLLDDYKLLKKARNTEGSYTHKILYPTLIIQPSKPKSGGKTDSSKDKKIDEKDVETKKKEHMYKAVNEGLKSSAEQLIGEYDGGIGRSDPFGRNGDCAIKKLTAFEVKQEQMRLQKLQEEALRRQAEEKDYTDAFQHNVLHNLPPDLVFRMNTHVIPEGYEFVSVYTPPEPAKFQEILDAYIRKVCTTFGIPKRIFDHEVQKWKSDITSETDPFVAKLVPLRTTLRSFFSCCYYAKNGHSLTQFRSQRIDKFFDQERKMINELLNKVIEQVSRLSFMVRIGSAEFVREQRQKIGETKRSLAMRDDLLKLRHKLDTVLMEEKLKEIKKYGPRGPPPPMPKPAASGSSGAKGGAKAPAKIPKSKVTQDLEDHQKLSRDSTTFEEGLQNRANSGQMQSMAMKGQQMMMGQQGASGGGGGSGGTGGKVGNQSEMLTWSQAGMYPETYLEDYEKQKELLILHKYIAYCIDTIDKFEESVHFIEKYRWEAVNLEFLSPIIVSLESIQKMMTMMPMSERHIKMLVGNKYGINTQ